MSKQMKTNINNMQYYYNILQPQQLGRFSFNLYSLTMSKSLVDPETHSLKER